MSSWILTIYWGALWFQNRPPSPTPSPLPVESIAPSPSASPVEIASLMNSFSFLDYLSNPFVLIIWGLFLISIVMLFRYWLRLRQEPDAIETMRRNAHTVVNIGERDREAIYQELDKDVPTGALAAKRVNELHHIGGRNGDFDQLALAEMTAAREHLRISFARYACSVLVLLGLCGAIYGLSNLVRKMGTELTQLDQLSTQNQQPSTPAGQNTSSPLNIAVSALVTTMSTSLQETKFAFAASLSGIILSIILLFFTWYVSHKQVRVLTELEELTATILIPLFKPPPEASELAGVVTAFKEGSGYLVRLSENMERRVELVGGSLDTLFAIVNKFGASASMLEGNQTKVTEAQDRLVRLVEDFKNLTQQIETHQAGARDLIGELTVTVANSDRNLNASSSTWQHRHELLLQELKLLAEKNSQAQRASNQALEGTRQLIKDAIDKEMNNLHVQTLSLLEKLQNANQLQLSAMVDKQSSFVTSLHDVVRSSDGHRELIDGMNDLFEQQRQIFSDGLGSFLREERQEYLARTELLIRSQTEMIETLRELPATLTANVRQKNGGNHVVESIGNNEQQLLIQQQAALSRQVGSLQFSTNHVTDLLEIGLCFSGAVVTFLGARGLMYQLNLWPVNLMWQAATLLLLLLLSSGIGLGLLRLIKRIK